MTTFKHQRSLIQRTGAFIVVALLLAACAAPTVKLEAEKRGKIKTIAILHIDQPVNVRVFSQSGATGIAGAIPGLGVLGAAIAGGVSGAIAGTTGKSDEEDFNRLIPAEQRQYADALTKTLEKELTAKGFTVILQPDVKVAVQKETKEFDYAAVVSPADAFVHVTYQYFGYFSPPFKDEYRPRISFTVKVLDAKSKEVVFSDRYSLNDTNREANGISSVGAGTLAIYTDSAALKNRADAAYQGLLHYQAFMAERFSSNLTGHWDDNAVTTPVVATKSTAQARGATVAPTGPIADVGAVPFLSEKGRSNYTAWLQRPNPKAFVISPSGYHSFASGTRPRDPLVPKDPTERALANCRAVAQNCQLYAVNDSVVWQGTAPAGATAATAAAPAVVSTAVAAADASPQVATSVPGDSNAVPYLNEEGRNEYRIWLRRPNPKAFALVASGHYASAAGTTPKDASLPADPSARALKMCQAAANEMCLLYAVDGVVVWNAKAASAASGNDNGKTAH